MEREKEQINPLSFLKIIVPLVFPLVGFLLPPLSPNMNTPTQINSYNNSNYEEEEEEQQQQPQMHSLVLASQMEFLSQNVVPIEQVEEEPSLQEEIERLNNRVSELEERENQIQLEFSEYCNMKNYESLVEKLQIMCLGLKMEYLESQNQRLEEAIAKLMEEKEELEAMRGEINSLKENCKKISRRNEHNLLMVQQRMQDYEAREAELLKRNEELMIQIKEKGNSKMKELTIEQGHATSLTQNEEMSNQINSIRAQWAADMEEMIYVGWIMACLRHELSTTDTIEEEKHKPKLEQNVLSIAFAPTGLIPASPEKKQIEEIVEVPVGLDEAQECNEVIQSESLVDCANSIMDQEEICMDVMVRNGGSSLQKPKLIHKLPEKKQIEEIVEVLVGLDEAQECNEVIQSESLVECANSIMDQEENCMDVMVRNGGSNLQKPKMIHKLPEKKQIEEIIEVLVGLDEAQECNEVIQSESLVECANSVMDQEGNCMDVMVRNGGSNLQKPKLIHKLKGWAKGKGKCKLSRTKII